MKEILQKKDFIVKPNLLPKLNDYQFHKASDFPMNELCIYKIVKVIDFLYFNKPVTCIALENTNRWIALNTANKLKSVIDVLGFDETKWLNRSIGICQSYFVDGKTGKTIYFIKIDLPQQNLFENDNINDLPQRNLFD